MSNELSTGGSGLVSLVDDKELGEVIKPLKTEIHLFDTYVAGTTHLENPEVLDSLKENDALSLQREDNKYDSNAILILNADKKKIGYVPAKDNIVFSRLMDAGKLLQAKVKYINIQGTFHQISIGIYLVDF